MRIITVGSVQEYAAEVVRVVRGDGDALPVLRPASAPTGAARPPARRRVPGQVLGFGDADWALPARLHAALCGREFAWYDDPAALVAAAAEGTGPLTVCAPQAMLSRAVQDAIVAATGFTSPHEAVAGVRFPARPLSYLTARTLPILTAVVAAHHRRGGLRVRSALGLFPDRMAGTGDDDVLTCLEGDGLTAAAVRAAGEPDLLMMWGHSREDLFNLGSDGLCGRSPESTQAGTRVPTCVHSGTCVKRGDVVPIHQVGASAVVMGGCNVLRLGDTGLFAPEFSLAFSAQEGGASVVVTAAGVVIGSPVEYLLLYRLLRGGTPVGEAVRLLNAALPFVGPDSPSYQVLGEGDRVLFDPPPHSAPVARTDAGEETRLEFTGVHAEFVAVRLPASAVGGQVRFTGDTPGRPELFSAVVPDPDGGATALLFGPRRLDGVDFTVEVGPRPPGGHAAAAVLSALTHAQAYGRLLRGYHPKLKSQEPEWRSTATHLLRQATRARHDVRACADADRKALSTSDAIHTADRVLCLHYLERTASARGFTFHEQCLFEDGTFTVVRHDEGGPCPYCGDRMMSRAVRSELVPQVRRELGICHTCGTIWDRPAEVPAPLLSLDPVLRPGVPVAVGLDLGNALDRPVRGWAGLTVRRARQFGYTTEPPPLEVVLEPGERRTVEFTLSTTEGVPTDAEFLRGYWSSELALTVAQRTIWTVTR